MSSIRVLSPDIQYTDEGIPEQEVAAGHLDLDLFRWGEMISPLDLAEYSGLLVWHIATIDAKYMDQLTKCRIIVRCGVGFDNVDLKAATERGIAVCNTPDYGTSEVADHTIGLILSLERQFAAYHHSLQQDPYKNFTHLTVPPGRRLRGRSIGLLGMGRIGTATALRAKAFGMRVVIYDPYLPRGQEISVEVERVESLEDLCRQVSVLSIHTPLTEETRGIVDENLLRLLPKDSILINTARGLTLDLDGVYNVLKDGHLRAAAIDVFPTEPPYPMPKLLQALQNNEVWLQQRLLVTPHTAWYSVDSALDLRRKSVETALLYLRDNKLRNCVNKHLLQPGKTFR
jgi:phosphoglycerate dehydrogenase-like enzyme